MKAQIVPMLRKLFPWQLNTSNHSGRELWTVKCNVLSDYSHCQFPVNERTWEQWL